MAANAVKRKAWMRSIQLFWLWLTSSEYRLMRQADRAIQEKRQEDFS